MAARYLSLDLDFDLEATSALEISSGLELLFDLLEDGGSLELTRRSRSILNS